MKGTQPFLREELEVDASGEDAFSWVEQIARAAPADAIYRAREGRVTLRFSHAGQAYQLPPEVSDHQRRPHIAHIKEGKIFILYNS